MNTVIEFLAVDLVYTDFLVGQDFVASMMSIIKALNEATGYEVFLVFKNFTVRINLKIFCHYFFKGCQD